jgi:hypothetical protein
VKTYSPDFVLAILFFQFCYLQLNNNSFLLSANGATDYSLSRQAQEADEKTR